MTVALSEAKGLVCAKMMRFFAVPVLERSEGLRMTIMLCVHFVRDSKLDSYLSYVLLFITSLFDFLFPFSFLRFFRPDREGPIESIKKPPFPREERRL